MDALESRGNGYKYDGVTILTLIALSSVIGTKKDAEGTVTVVHQVMARLCRPHMSLEYVW